MRFVVAHANSELKRRIRVQGISPNVVSLYVEIRIWVDPYMP